jgi:hypothetical protein
MEAAHRGYVITADGFYDVAVVRDIGNEDNPANARLIAAAPDLLHACRECKSGIKGWEELMHAAIAKAEGE